MKMLDFEPVEIKAYIKPNQDKTLERIKYEGKIKKDMKIPKTEIIRTALDLFFEMSDEKILEMLTDRINSIVQ